MNRYDKEERIIQTFQDLKRRRIKIFPLNFNNILLKKEKKYQKLKAKYNKSQLYFFKFPNTFFDSDEIEDILKDDDGPSIVILYLKLILLATNKMGYLGRIIDGELKPYTTEELYKKNFRG